MRCPAAAVGEEAGEAAAAVEEAVEAEAEEVETRARSFTISPNFVTPKATTLANPSANRTSETL